MQFSDPQSVTRSKGQPPTSCTCLRKKAAGTLGSLLVRATSNHKILRLNPSTAPCIGNPYGFSLSYPRKERVWASQIEGDLSLTCSFFQREGRGVILIVACSNYIFLPKKKQLPSICQEPLAPFDTNVLLFNRRDFRSSTPTGSISFIIFATKLRGT